MTASRFNTTQLFNSSVFTTQSRCEAMFLRTDSAGCIALPLDPLGILDVLNRLPSVCIQVAHADGRFVARYGQRAVVPLPGGCRIGAVSGRVDIAFSEIRSIHATVRECPCCGSPGEVVFLNHQGIDLLRVCADTSIPASDWGQAVAACLRLNAAAAPIGEPLPEPFVAPRAVAIDQPVWELRSLLESVGTAGLQIPIELVAADALHRHHLIMEGAYRQENRLIVQGGGAGLEIALSSGHRLFVEEEASIGPRLSVVAESGERLLSFCSSGSGADRSFFDYLFSVWLRTAQKKA